MKEKKPVTFNVHHKEDELQEVFHPWRRFLARFFDITMYNVFWSAFLAFTFHINILARSNGGNLFDSFITIIMMLFIEPIWLRLLGTTPGKAIFGLRIELPDGRRLSYSEGLERTWGVIGNGLGFNIPIYNLVRLWKSYKLCSENEPQPWDELTSYTLKDTKWFRGVLYIAAYITIFAVLLVIVFAQQTPPNRGDLTVAEFVENYNYYANYFGIDFGNEYLDENGKWAKKDFNGTVYIKTTHSEMPEYDFTVENGYVTGVSFAVAIKNNRNWIRSYNPQMVLASLAFVGAQNEVGLFSKIPDRISSQIQSSTFDDFRFTEAGIEFNCDTEYSGYINTKSGFLLPKENAKGTYFSLNFSMNKQY